ncbi:M48 family metalloprotease [Kribbella sp. NPDC056345]|uniref:M48 family metalloprotease n=1 Tax=Kribbella sp. NPDC056345 TaxID=3345789 RepID=UPI0035D68AAE
MTTHHAPDTTTPTEVDDRWEHQDPTVQAMVDEIATAAGCPATRVVVVPWIGYREPGDAIGDGGLAEVHQPFRRTEPATPATIYLAAPVLSDLSPEIGRHLLAHELGHVTRHGRLHTAVDHLAALAVWPVTAAAAVLSWSIGARGAEFLLTLAAAAWGLMKLANWAWELVQEIQADDFTTQYAPLTADQVDQLWSYLDTHLGTDLGGRYRGYRLMRNARRTAQPAVLEAAGTVEEA